MWVGIALASLAALIILVLCIPFDMVLRLGVYGVVKLKMSVSWLFGGVSQEVGQRKRKPKRKAAEAKPKLIERGKGARTALGILQTRGLPGQLKRLLKGIIHCFKIQKFEADFRVGLDNPADTGFLFGLIGPTLLFTSSSFPYPVRVRPAFDEAVFEGYLHGTIRLWPIQLVPSIFRFVFSLTTVRVIKKLVLTKWKRRK